MRGVGRSRAPSCHVAAASGETHAFLVPPLVRAIQVQVVVLDDERGCAVAHRTRVESGDGCRARRARVLDQLRAAPPPGARHQETRDCTVSTRSSQRATEGT
jgi:hypothetical protein